MLPCLMRLNALFCNISLPSVAAGAQDVLEFPGFDNLQYMQDMTSAKCYHASIGETKQLTDIRDNKKYWVTKLKDGNCWMTQNLDLDLYVNNTGRTLTASDSDVAGSWTSTTGASGLWTSDTGDYNMVKYYDPGDKYCSDNTTDACNLTSSNNNGHDSQGNHYSWGAATADTGKNVSNDGDIAPSSVCPKGWKLPLSGDQNGSNNTVSGSFKYLVDAYSIGANAAGSTALRSAPLYFVYGGYVNNSSLNNAGSYGYYWSSTANSATYAYRLYFNSSNVNPSDNFNRYFGYSVRCVAR